MQRRGAARRASPALGVQTLSDVQERDRSSWQIQEWLLLDCVDLVDRLPLVLMQIRLIQLGTNSGLASVCSLEGKLAAHHTLRTQFSSSLDLSAGPNKAPADCLTDNQM